MGDPPRISVDLGFEGQSDPRQVSLLACGFRKPRIPRLPSYSFPFPALLFRIASGRPAPDFGAAWKFRTAYSDELASEFHGIPRYAIRIPCLMSGFVFRRLDPKVNPLSPRTAERFLQGRGQDIKGASSLSMLC